MCDEWLTTLCAMTWLIAGADCGLIGVGVDEEQARKVCTSGPPGVQRQVGLVRGSQWPTGSSAGRMVARTTTQSRVRFLGWASKSRSSQYNRGDQVMSGDCRGGHTKSARFAVVHHKTAGLLNWATKQDRRLGTTDRPKPIWLVWSRASRSFEAEDTRHDRKGCVGDKQACGLCAYVQ
jgi:hypothetical protein